MKKSVVISIIILLILGIFMGSVNAASATISTKVSNSSPKVGDTITVTVLFSAPVGTASLNLSYNNSVVQYLNSNAWKATNNGNSVKLEYFDASYSNKAVNSMTATFKVISVGSSQFTVSGVVISDANAEELAPNIGASASIKATAKTNTTPTKKPTTTTNKKDNTNKTDKNNTDTNTNTNITEQLPQFGINSLTIKGIRKITNGQGGSREEGIELQFSPEFNINTYEYLCYVDKTIDKIEIMQDAGIYNENIKIEGLEDDLKEGQNVITIRMSREGQEDIEYTIKVIKELSEDTIQEDKDDVNEDKNKPDYLQYEVIAIIAIVVILIFIVIIIRMIKNN